MLKMKDEQLAAYKLSCLIEANKLYANKDVSAEAVIETARKFTVLVLSKS